MTTMLPKLSVVSSESELAAFERQSRLEAELLTRQTLDELEAAFLKSTRARNLAASELDDLEQQLSTLELRAASLPKVSLISLLLTALAVLAGCVSEVALTIAVLPPLLNIPPDGPLGLALGFICLIIAVAIEAGLRHCFTASHRAVRTFHQALLLLNTLTVGLLAVSREEAARLLRSLTDLTTDSTPAVNEQLVACLVLFVSVTVILDVALLTMTLLDQSSASWQHFASNVHTSLLRRRKSRATEELKRAERLVQELQPRFDNRARMAAIQCDVLFSRSALDVEHVRARRRSLSESLDIAVNRLVERRLHLVDGVNHDV